MADQTQIGRIVWHDLLTNEVAGAMHFYAELLGWEYQIEHATEFAWKSGEADYPLILADGKAHGGVVDPGKEIPSHWVAYVTVHDVDAVVNRAKRLGATIEREPFDVPGVGRNAVIRDPQGAIVCPYVPTHVFPPPAGTFVWDELITDEVEPAKTFYGELFGWTANDAALGQMGAYTIFKCAGNTDAAGVNPRQLEGPALWLPYLATDDVDTSVANAMKLGAAVCMEGIDVPNIGRLAVLADPTGAAFGLIEPSEASALDSNANTS